MGPKFGELPLNPKILNYYFGTYLCSRGLQKSFRRTLPPFVELSYEDPLGFRDIWGYIGEYWHRRVWGWIYESLGFRALRVQVPNNPVLRTGG